MTLALLVLVAYFLGAIPVGVLVARARGVDILNAGSGNIGATNVGRVLGKGPGLAVWGLDVLKSLAPTLAARALVHAPLGPLDAQTQWFLVGAAAILGHCASPFLGFRGGKGISTALGAMIGTAPLVALLCFGLFALVLWATRYMAIASTVGVSSVVLFAWLLGVTPQLLPVFVLLALFVAYRHRSNFARLKAGTEPRFSFRKAPSSSPRPEAHDNEKAPSGDEGGAGGGAKEHRLPNSPAPNPARIRLCGNSQLPDPHNEGPGLYTVQIVDSILTQFLSVGKRLELVQEADMLHILFDGQPNGQLPSELAEATLRRIALLADMDPLKHRQNRAGKIAGEFDGMPFELSAESFPIKQGVVFVASR